MSKPKILRITTADISLNGLLKGQLRFLNQYYEVVGVAADSGVLHEVAEREGIRVVHIPMHREISLWADTKALGLLIRLFRRERPSIVHANTPKASLLSMIAAWLVRIPHRIYTVTGLRFETTHGIFRLILKTMERITCFCATDVIPEGDGVKATLYGERITRKPMHKILNGNINGIDTAWFDRTEAVQEAAKPYVRDAFTFIFIGRMVRDKGINELVAAFDHLHTVEPKTRLLLVGRFEDALDPVAPQTKHIIQHNSGIEFVGYQSDVRPFLAAANALAFPSYREGFPNVVLQAGAMGLPSIVTDINGSNEIIRNLQNGIIIPPRNEKDLHQAMLYFVQHRDEVQQMATQSRAMITSRYEQRNVWQALLLEYEQLLQSE